MSIISAALNNKIQNFEEAFKVKDITSEAMKAAIKDWFWLYYNKFPTDTEDPWMKLTQILPVSRK